MASELYDLSAGRRELGPQTALFGSDRNLLFVAIGLGLVLLVWKIFISSVTNVLWDEAHFFVSGQHPDLGYPDIPAGYPWLTWLLSSVFGWSLVPMRVVALIIACLIAPAVYFMARPVVSHRHALWAAILALICPAVTMNGTILYPEGGLQLCLALMCGCLLRAIQEDRMKWWLLTGVCAAFGLLIHFRFLIAGAGILLFLVATTQGRALWRRPGLYTAAAVAFTGLVPSLIYNLVNDWPALQYHVVNRPRLEFRFSYILGFLATQLAIATPVLFVAMVGGGQKVIRQDKDSPGTVLVWVGVTVFAFYCLLAFVNKKIMPHWPWMAFVPLLAYAPGAMIRFADAASTMAGRWQRTALIALAPLMTLGFAVAFSVKEYANFSGRPVPNFMQNFSETKNEKWSRLEPELAAARTQAEARFGPNVALAINGHNSAVRLEFPGAKGRAVFTLDDPDDKATRFVVARAKWGLDRAGLLRAQAGRGVVLVLNQPTYVYHSDADIAFYTELCGLFDAVERSSTTILPPGRTEVSIYTARVRAKPLETLPKAPCPLLPSLYIARPTRGEYIKVDDEAQFFGIAADVKGIASVDILVDDKVVTKARYGLDPEGFRAPGLLDFDPNYPKVQYDFKFPAGSLTPGEHTLSIEATRSDGTKVRSDPRRLFVNAKGGD